jgi:hypothetical protein
MIEFLKKYAPKHYNHYLPVIINKIGEQRDIHKFIKNLGSNDILIWLKAVSVLEKNSISHFEESTIVITLVIRLFILELDITDAKLTNKEIIKLVKRFKKSLTTELAYRKDIITKTPKYSILKDT